jgi:hypothetical protein
MMVLLERLKAQKELHLSEEQAGFRKDRNTTHQILIIRLLAEKAKLKRWHMYHCFIDFQKDFDTIKHLSLIELVRGYYSYCRTYAKLTIGSGVGKEL